MLSRPNFGPRIEFWSSQRPRSKPWPRFEATTKSDQTYVTGEYSTRCLLGHTTQGSGSHPLATCFAVLDGNDAHVARPGEAPWLKAGSAESPATRRRDRSHEVLTKLFMWRGSAIARAGRKF